MNREQILAEVARVVEYGNKRFRVSRPIPVVKFTQKGRVAGRCWYGAQLLEFNEILARENSSLFQETVIHEVAHLFTFFLYPNAKQNHGPEFRSVCRALGGTGRTYHNYDISSVSRKNKIQRHVYKCSCREHTLTTTKHNRALKGAQFLCIKCRQKIVFVTTKVIVR